MTASLSPTFSRAMTWFVGGLCALLLVLGISWYGWSIEIHRRFWADIFERVHGPMTFRFYLQPTMALLAAIPDGIKDALGDTPLYAGAEFHPSGGILAGAPAKGSDTRATVLGKPYVGQVHAAVVGQRTVTLTWNIGEEDKAKLAPGLAMVRNTLTA